MLWAKWVQWLHKPGVLGLVNGDCPPFYFYLFHFITFLYFLCTSLYISVHFSSSVHFSILQYISSVHYNKISCVYYSTFQYIAVYYSILQYITVHFSILQYISSVHFSILQYIVCTLQQNIVCIFQYITVHFSILQYIMANTYVFSGFSWPTWWSGWPWFSRSTSKLSDVYIVVFLLNHFVVVCLLLMLFFCLLKDC